MSIYEVHLGSWRRKGNNEWLTYRELAEQLPRLCARSRLHPCRISARQRTSVRRLMGLSADRAVRADQPVRHAGGFCRAGRCLPSRRDRRDARLGARAFSRRSARPRPFRRHRALRARQSAAGPPPRLGHADLQLRPHRSGQFPGLQRAVLARPLRRRRPARRCRRLDALSRLQPARRRLDSEQIWRPRKPRSHRFPAPLQHRSVRAFSAGHHGRRRIHRMAAGVAARSNMAGSASATNGTWAGCTTR